jgi:hypothetical protein
MEKRKLDTLTTALEQLGYELYGLDESLDIPYEVVHLQIRHPVQIRRSQDKDNPAEHLPQ